MATSENDFYRQFVAMGPGGVIDMRRTLKNFETAVGAWAKAHEELKPTILAELKEWKRLGEGTLINFVLHRLHQQVSSDNVENVKQAIAQLVDSGDISYNTNQAGSRRGRNAGYVLGQHEEDTSTK